VLRRFLLAALAGAIGTLVLLANLKLVELPHIAPLLTSGEHGDLFESWIVEARDRLASTGPGVAAWPRDILPLDDAELRGLSVTTMKVRDTAGTVIGVASRIVGIEATESAPSIWWSFVIGDRGTLAAQIPDATRVDDGRLLGGTSSFAGVEGAFLERPLADGGSEIRFVRAAIVRP
jgi:hypothetical protein